MHPTATFAQFRYNSEYPSRLCREYLNVSWYLGDKLRRLTKLQASVVAQAFCFSAGPISLAYVSKAQMPLD